MRPVCILLKDRSRTDKLLLPTIDVYFESISSLKLQFDIVSHSIIDVLARVDDKIDVNRLGAILQHLRINCLALPLDMISSIG